MSTRIKELNANDWKKLVIMINNLNGKNVKQLTLSVDVLKIVQWYMNASVVIHPDIKNHTEAFFTTVQV